MTPIVGVFRTRTDAEMCSAELQAAEFPKSKIHLVTPETSKEELGSVPAVHAEEPGMGKAMGAVVGGAMGLAGGLEVAEVLMTMMPGVGVIAVLGLSGSALLAALGAFGGGAVGGALENSIFDGLPAEELFVYRDALRKGRSVVILTPTHADEAALARQKLRDAGAESIDQAREDWWLGLRDEEKEKYRIQGGDFDHDEREFRQGFEAAQRPENHDKSYEFASAQLVKQYPDSFATSAFRADTSEAICMSTNLINPRSESRMG